MDIKSIFVKATFARDIVSRYLAWLSFLDFFDVCNFIFALHCFRLDSLSLDTATEDQNGESKINVVEKCSCPVGYDGLSCEVKECS